MAVARGAWLALLVAQAARLAIFVTRAAGLPICVAQAAPLAMPVARTSRLRGIVLLVARTARLAERRVGARQGLGRLRRGRQNQSSATALRARRLAHSDMPRQGSSLVFANDGGAD
jgi:hypothetical protein